LPFNSLQSHRRRLSDPLVFIIRSQTSKKWLDSTGITNIAKSPGSIHLDITIRVVQRYDQWIDSPGVPDLTECIGSIPSDI